MKKPRGPAKVTTPKAVVLLCPICEASILRCEFKAHVDQHLTDRERGSRRGYDARNLK